MNLRKEVAAVPIWKYEELPPAALIASLHLATAAIDENEFARAEWFWSKRPKVLSESLSIIFFYLLVFGSLSYFVPGTISFLLLWMVAGASCASVDRMRLDRWREEYESSIERIVSHLAQRK
jgi:hypothetical protein